MKVFGVRCSTKDIIYAILDGCIGQPNLIEVRSINIPKGLKRHEELKWLQTEMLRIISENSPDLLTLKETEATARRSNSYRDRVENEAIVILAAANGMVAKTYRKVKATIAKDLGLKGKAKYLESNLDRTKIPHFNDLSSQEQEAILAAWSTLQPCR